MKLDVRKKKLVSVIVPVYKVEAELDRCVQSLLRQTYESIEILLIDDGSPDNCPKLCDSYKEKDGRIKVIHKTNGGLSSARNSGLDMANGEYISFVDSDDWVANDFIEILVNNIEKENADISIIGYTMIWENGKTRRYSKDEQYFVFDKEQAIKELLIQKKFQCMVWQKLYKCSIFCSLRFPEGKLYEDVAVSLPSFEQCSKVVYCGESKYFYYQRSGSITNSIFHEDKLYFLECIKGMIEYSETQSGLYDKEAYSFYLRAVMLLLLQAYQIEKHVEQKRWVNYLTKEIILNKKYIWSSPYLELRKKIVLTLMMLHFPQNILLKLWINR